MFKHGFPPEWSTFKKLIWLKGAGIIGGISAVWKTVTGTLIHITDALASPMQKCEVTLEPIQAGSGDPSPTNVRPITGWTGCEAFNDPAHGGFINWNQKSKNRLASYTQNGMTAVYADGCYSLSGKATGSYSQIIQPLWIKSSHVFVQRVKIIANPDNVSFEIGSLNGKLPNLTPSDLETYTVVIAASGNVSMGFQRMPIGTVTDGIVFSYQIFDLTEMFGAGNEPTKAEFDALFPKDYYPYNAGKETTVSAVNGDPYQHLSVTFPDSVGTVYGGTYDFVSGDGDNDRIEFVYDGTEDWGKNGGYGYYVDVAQYQTLLSDDAPISNYCVGYTPGSGSGLDTWTLRLNTSKASLLVKPDTSVYDTTDKWKAYLDGHPLQVVFKRNESIPFTSTPQQVSTNAGENNVWGDGNIEMTYKAQG